MTRRNTGRGRRNLGSRAPADAAVPLEQQILAAYAAVGWTVQVLFLARASDVSLVGGKVELWADRSGNGRDAVQATDAARPTWDAAGINSRPSLSFDGADLLVAPAFALTGQTGLVYHVVWRQPLAATAALVSWNNNLTPRWVAQHVSGAATVSARDSATSVSAEATSTFTTASVTTYTWDRALTTNEATIYKNGADATTSRASNSNSTGSLTGSFPLGIGAWSEGSVGLVGHEAVVILATGTTAIPAARATVDALLMAEWGIAA